MLNDDLTKMELISALRTYYVLKFNELNSSGKLKDTKVESVRASNGLPLFLSNSKCLIERVNDGLNNIGKLFRNGKEIHTKMIDLDDYVSPSDLVNYSKIDNFLERLNTIDNDALYDTDSIDNAPIEYLDDIICSIFERDDIDKLSQKDRLNILIETYLGDINKNGKDIYSEVLAYADQFAEEFFSINDFDYQKRLKLEIYRGEQALGYFEFKDDGKYYMTLIVEQKDTSETDLLVASSLLLKSLKWSDIETPHSGRQHILRYTTNVNFLKENFEYIAAMLK
ncbi:MAG: hypothetical protein GQ477_00925 [Nanohaloarchaea archaeon]|nr:hypothetical protein [Candidatus Nanohaloarchaea archaeon]